MLMGRSGLWGGGGKRHSWPLTGNPEHERGIKAESNDFSKEMGSEGTARCTRHSTQGPNMVFRDGQDATPAKWESGFPVGGHHLWQRIWARR